MDSGWIKLHRKFIKSAIWESHDSYLIQVFVYCLFNASWQDKEVIIGNTVVNLKRGQFITGRKSLVRHLTNIKIENSKNFKKMETLYKRKIELLEKLNFLNIKSTNKYSIITIQKYNEYQTNEQQMNNKRTTDEQQMNTTKEYKNIRKKEYIYNIYFQKFLENFNSLYKSEYKQTRKLNELYTLRRKTFSSEELMIALNCMYEIPFYRGRNDNGWKPTPEFFLRSDEKIDEFLNTKKISVKQAEEYEISPEGLARVKKMKKEAGLI